MALSSTLNKKVFTASAAQTAFAFGDVLYFDHAHLQVYVNGVRKTLGTHYTVSPTVNTPNGTPGGTVTFLAPMAGGEQVVVLRVVPIVQEIDYQENEKFPANTHERGLDWLTMVSQQLQEESNRSAKLPVSSNLDPSALVDDLLRLADSAANIDTVAGSIANVNIDAAAIAAINTVAGISGNVTTVAGSVANVNTCAANMAAIIAAPTQAANAATSASNASTSASGAATSATNAATSAANAASSATAAEAALDQLTDIYLGAKASDPSVDNDGGPLTVGDWYFNTTSNISRIYNGSSWADLTVSSATVVAKTGATGSAVLPAGTTGQRDGSPSAGYLRFNSTSTEFEGYNGTAWSSVGGSTINNDTATNSTRYPLFAAATAGTAATVHTSDAKLLYKPSTGELKSSVLNAGNGIVVNNATVGTSYTIAAGENGLSVGPITLSGGVVVTITSGQRWAVL